MTTPYFVPNEGSSLAAARYSSDLAASGSLILFQYPSTVSPDIAYTSLIEANFPGYSRKPLVPTITGLSTGGVATVSFATESWTCTGGTPANTIYGAAAIGTAGSVTLIAAIGTFGSGVSMSNSGDNIASQLTLTVQPLS